jgi:hypothetical protein
MTFLIVLHGASNTPFGIGWSLRLVFSSSKGISGDSPVEGMSRGINCFLDNVAGPPWVSTASMAGNASPGADQLWKPPRGGAQCGAHR